MTSNEQTPAAPEMHKSLVEEQDDVAGHRHALAHDSEDDDVTGHKHMAIADELGDDDVEGHRFLAVSESDVEGKSIGRMHN